MPMDIHVREATEADLPAILGLYRQLGEDDGRVLDLAAAQKIFARICACPEYRLHVALTGERVVGVYGLMIMDNLGHMGTPSAIVEDVVVAEDQRGQGLGGLMMAHAATLARTRGCYKIMLSSNRARESAHRFYEGLGFVRHGHSFRLDLAGEATEQKLSILQQPALEVQP